MTKRIKKILLWIIGVVFVLGVAVVGLAWYVLNSFDQAFTAGQYPHRPDAEMIRNFNEHRREFEEVLTMAMADKSLRRIDDDWSDPTNLDSSKIDEYRRLFVVIGTPRGISKYNGQGRVEFLASTLGWVTSGSTKGYLYTEQKPSGNFVDSLDDVAKLRDLDIDYLKPIDGNWYLYFRR